MTREEIARYIQDHSLRLSDADALDLAGCIHTQLDFTPMMEQVDNLIWEAFPGQGANAPWTPPWALNRGTSGKEAKIARALVEASKQVSE